MKPCTVKDEVGNLMLWYIPGCFTVPRSVSCLLVPPRSTVTAVKQHQMWKNLKTLQRSLLIKKNVNSWRVAPTHFRVEEGWLKPGSVSMSPAWFQQAHEVCTNRLVIWFSLTYLYRNPMSSRFPRRLPRHIPWHGWRCK